jgi:hypothetical protein
MMIERAAHLGKPEKKAAAPKDGRSFVLSWSGGQLAPRLGNRTHA